MIMIEVLNIQNLEIFLFLVEEKKKKEKGIQIIEIYQFLSYLSFDHLFFIY